MKILNAPRKFLKAVLAALLLSNFLSAEVHDLEKFTIERSEEKKSIYDFSTDEIYERLKEKGIVLLRGFDVSTRDFIAFSNQFPDTFLPYQGGSIRPNVDGDPTAIIITEKDGNHSVYFHGEQYYQKIHATTFWMYAFIPPVADGATLLCDGRELYARLPEEIKQLFMDKKIKYSRCFPREKWQKIYQVTSEEELEPILNKQGINYFIDENSNLHTTYITEAIQQEKWANSPIFINNALEILEDMQDMHPKYNPEKTKETICVTFEDDTKIPIEVINQIQQIIAEIKMAVRWQKNDVLIFDNTRILHARERFPENSRRELVSRLSIH
ncbi:TauD/TfdA family dioxygenase [Candidatus Rhabdochlamydia porcellionis]|jgi:alpha-ketoglutarate-dependent taurine dioxygenase|uniref:Taurine catabolism dioxygenase TauD n=1 Tax=Candidatus Rhabdochlamydia porcellionis TaxID=225148 RepID=A0ABX8Z2H5_9BACT|nr:TauD/TfdA family dioxygenase [Candidatus Rhabdochlamydia porcellionis]QZA58757.1 Taurine catabolism dioxygenase TauD [Candidatus Rhabdochlamydia porcellionis]